MSRKLIFDFDGTLNGRDDKVPTNIRRIHRGITGPNEISFYLAGPGNEDENSWFGQAMGATFGWGSTDIRDEALKTLDQVYRHGDSIIVFGFSRGATIARMFAAHVCKQGVLGFNPGIDFLGCFDTVAAFLPFGPSQQGAWHDLHVHPKVKYAAHAVAINEDREAFEPNLMNYREGICEMWFQGVHADIGGGYEDTSLSDRALVWMTTQVFGRTGLVVDLEKSPVPDMTAKVGDNSGAYPRSPRRLGVKRNGIWSHEKPLIYEY